MHRYRARRRLRARRRPLALAHSSDDGSRKKTNATKAKNDAARAKRPKPTARKAPSKKGLAAHERALAELRAFGLALPEAHTKSPWPGHLDLAVRDKTFAYLNAEMPLSISCKLPHSCHEALGLPFTAPTGYGLGKSGWVTATFKAHR